jgi:hypothetical protein
MQFCKNISTSCEHIHREGNMVADALAKNGEALSMYTIQWWPAAPPFYTL